MDATCILYGPVIAGVVSVLKRVPFFTRNHKVIVAVISMLIAGYHVYSGSVPLNVQAIAECVAQYFAGAVATYEVVSGTVSAVKGT